MVKVFHLLLCRTALSAIQALLLRGQCLAALALRIKNGSNGSIQESTKSSTMVADASARAHPAMQEDPYLRRVFERLAKDRNGILRCHATEVTDLRAVSGTPQRRGCAPLDYEEFLRFYSDGDEELAEAFAVYDLDGDGFITSEELKKVLVGMGFGYCDNERFCQLIIQSADANSDGKIDFVEFCHMMSSNDCSVRFEGREDSRRSPCLSLPRKMSLSLWPNISTY
ncbi:hypothetical protein KP509_35G042500 [Ceratopteris richardii]|uniref:EF-hand domain-containing protein n=1 Tax=Ceratopteris richardii TaxID=49495 RepID=A0A8T2QG11_CERRI|nr:hypothetical protein KP509_35G042500 [Ceratopteris richardii]